MTHIPAPKEVLFARMPLFPAAPLVIDSPHSGTIYPDDFDYACPKDWLSEAEDAHVDILFGAAQSLGLPFLSAQFPRSYIDVNRAVDDIDDKLLSRAYPSTTRPTTRSARGFGLIRRLYKQQDPRPIYNRYLTVDDIRHRIDAYYKPYHAALKELTDTVFDRFGVCYLLNCHSMPTQDERGRHSYDIVLGDRDGSTCSADYLFCAKEKLDSMGYKTSINDPYKGVEIVRLHGRPRENRHALQIEIARGLYMDETTRLPHDDFDQHKNNMTILMKHLIDFTSENSTMIAAE